MAGLLPSVSIGNRGLATQDMAKTTPAKANTATTNQYVEVFNHPISFTGAFLLLSGFQDSDLKRSVSIVYCKSHTSLSAPVVIPLYGGSDRLSIYGRYENGICRYCVKVPSAYMHIQSVSLHPGGTNLANTFSDISDWSLLI